MRSLDLLKSLNTLADKENYYLLQDPDKDMHFSRVFSSLSDDTLENIVYYGALYDSRKIATRMNSWQTTNLNVHQAVYLEFLYSIGVDIFDSLKLRTPLLWFAAGSRQRSGFAPVFKIYVAEHTMWSKEDTIQSGFQDSWVAHVYNLQNSAKEIYLADQKLRNFADYIDVDPEMEVKQKFANDLKLYLGKVLVDSKNYPPEG